MATRSTGPGRAARARCGVYDCGACGLYRDGKCPGCASGNLRLKRGGEAVCSVYECVRTLGFAGCHECTRATCVLGDRTKLKCQLRVTFGGARPSQGFPRRLDATRGAGTIQQASGRLADRLRGYLRVLSEYERGDVRVVSSHQLARGIGIRATLVRRDLAELGGLGTPGRGYEVGPVTRAIREALDLERERRTIWLGVRAAVDWPLAIDALQAVNCSLVGVFDDDAQGDVINRLVVQPLGRAAGEARRTGATVAVIASARAAQLEILEGLADAGVRGMLNLTPLRLDLTSRVVIEQCDLGNQLLRLVSRLGGD